MLSNKRLILVGLVMMFIAGYFWAGSRVPDLNEKALMGGETQLDAIGFNVVIEVKDDDPIYKRVFATTINWVKTNQKGMTFGVMFGAVLMTLLTLFRRRSFKSGFANTVLGIAIGSPLGVCVNCAAPIAQGLASAGAPVQTVFATMVSSPTLNIIVLTMLFSLFPMYMVMIKIGLTLAFVLIAIPVMSRFLAKDALVQFEDASCDIPADGGVAPEDETWLSAARWTVVHLLKNLWYIVRMTVPLMFLAGLLGSLAIVLLPLDTLAGMLPADGRNAIIASMAGLAAIGIFLPVPMAFDVLVAAILMAAGMPARYVAVLLFTLGIFSIYAFFIAWRSMPRRLVAVATMVLMGFGLAAGLIGHVGFEWNLQREAKLYFKAFGDDVELLGPTVVVSSPSSNVAAIPTADSSVALTSTMIPIDADGRVVIERIPFLPNRSAGSTPFTRIEGPRVGLDQPYAYSVLNFLELSRFRGIASGDIDRDGWADILLTSDRGVQVFMNQAGQGFTREPVRIDSLADLHVFNAALVDLDDDGWLDIFLAAYREGSYVIYSDQGRFTGERVVAVPNRENAVVAAASTFGDIDRDGDLDMALGNWSVGVIVGFPNSMPSSENVLVHNDDGTFRLEQLGGIYGETMTALYTDFDSDDRLDLIMGNDFSPPDYIYRGNGDGTFRTVTRSDDLIEHTTNTTMSIASADINNDLKPEIYFGQISGRATDTNSELHRVGPETCAEIQDPDARRECEYIMSIQAKIVASRAAKSVFQCQIEDEFQDDCIGVLLLLSSVLWSPNAELCDLFRDGWETFHFVCETGHEPQAEIDDAEMRNSLPQRRRTNVLLSQNDEGKFVDVAKQMGVGAAGWTWNAKFADVDNDEWQDLLAVNGQLFLGTRESNVFYKNEGGERFSRQTEEFGLGSLLSTSAYTYVDFDNDGDLDLFTVPAAGPIFAYVNNAAGNHAVAFELRDEVGNHFGIGSKITVYYGPGDARHQVRELQSGGGFVSYDAPVGHFGLGAFDRVNRVEVVWSTGERTAIRGPLPAGSKYIIRRAAGAVQRID